MTQLDDMKKALRAVNAKRRKQAHEAMPDAALKIAQFADDIIAHTKPRMVAAYWPIRTEIDPIILLDALAERGAETCLPATPQEGQPLRFHQWATGDALIEGPYHTKEPYSQAPLAVPDLILAPLLAYDGNFWRLGYGGGFYDRTLAQLEAQGHEVCVIGISFDECEVEAVPTGPYDRQLSGILTPTALRLAANSS